MDPSVFVLQPYLVVATMVSVLVAAIAWLAFRARKKGEPPIITASTQGIAKGLVPTQHHCDQSAALPAIWSFIASHTSKVGTINGSDNFSQH